MTKDEWEDSLMNDISLRMVSKDDASFLFSIMNMDVILDSLNEIPTQLCDWEDAISAWEQDDDEEDYIICKGETPIGWLGVNGLASADSIAYLKIAALLPGYHNKGIGCCGIAQIIAWLKQRNYAKIALYTDQDNHRAKACYRKCGFEITETFTEEMANGKTVARCKMELVL